MKNEARQTLIAFVGSPECLEAIDHEVAALFKVGAQALCIRLAFRRALALVILAVLLRVGALAQDAYFLALQGHGQASVVLSRDVGIAYIKDGGQRGGGGINGVQLCGLQLADALRSFGTRHLVIICSHPHADHLGGLVELVQDYTNLAGFESVDVVDAGYMVGAGRDQSLWSTLEATLKLAHMQDAGCQYPTSTYRSASGKNALADISRPEDAAYVSNFVYEPQDTSIHGNAVITQYELHCDGKTQVLVDFDDASESLVRQWIATGQHVDTVVIPHHGSENDSVEQILRTSARDCIVAVNAENRYQHPGLQNLAKLVKHFGRRKVHLTGSELHIVVNSSGIAPLSDQEVYDRTLAVFVLPRAREISDELQRLSIQYSAALDNADEDVRSALAADIAECCESYQIVSELVQNLTEYQPRWRDEIGMRGLGRAYRMALRLLAIRSVSPRGHDSRAERAAVIDLLRQITQAVCRAVCSEQYRSYLWAFLEEWHASPEAIREFLMVGLSDRGFDENSRKFALGVATEIALRTSPLNDVQAADRRDKAPAVATPDAIIDLLDATIAARPGRSSIEQKIDTLFGDSASMNVYLRDVESAWNTCPDSFRMDGMRALEELRALMLP